MNSDNSANESINANNDTKENNVRSIQIVITDGSFQETITLNSEQVEKFFHTADNIDKSYSETTARVYDRGMYDINYRHDRNVKEYNAFKEWKKAQKATK